MSVLITDESAKQLIHIAQSIARENYNATYGGSHLLQALMHKDIGLRDFLSSIDKDPAYIYDWADVRIEEYPKTGNLPSEPIPDEKIDKILEEADEMRLKLGLDEVNPLCILTAITKANVVYTAQELKSLPLREHEILNHFQGESKQIHNQENNLLSGLQDSKLSFPAITAYCVDMTKMAADGKIETIVGRDKELRQLVEILCRKTKPNVIIVGEPGVGKTALLEGFASEINIGNVPELLKEATLLELDTGALLAGTSYKGEIEDRLKKVINECKKINKAILFIDEIHALLDSKGSAGNVANLLKPELARGEITVIGATTQEEYRKIIEPERAFDRRFEVLMVEEPDEAACVKMIKEILESYKEHHGVDVDENSLGDCVKLAKRYSKGKKLPDSAIDLLDRTMASIKMLDELSEGELQKWKENYEEIIKDTPEDDPLLIDELLWNFQLLQNKLSPILWGSLSEQHVLDNSMDVSQIKKTRFRKT